MSETAALRKTVTVLFCDLAGSTELGEQLDPESLRTVMARWYTAMRTPLEGHGGTVEKFIGDAVMAVFGVPQVHEDDALRAVRAALEMRDAAAELQLPIRIGINSGEVITGDITTTLVTGDAVNTAKRLEQAARAGDILIGAGTRRLVENATRLEPADTVAAKGKRDPVGAWRVLGTIAGASHVARRLDAPLVGRIRELEELHAELDTAERDGTCRVITVYGAAGVGKSRLAVEFMTQTRDRATVLTARCPPYGDGITFLPLTDLLRSAGADPSLLEAAETGEEMFFAVRRRLEDLARERPLVACIEDVHWAQPTFLDLLEYVAGWSRAPMLLLCLARPELLDERPRWGGASLNLEPLTGAESELLLEELGAEWPLRLDARARIAEAAEGNPLFLEQMVAMLSDDGSSENVPPTIQALLAARLDRLEPVERAVLERAAVVGKEFWRGAVIELSPQAEQAQVSAALLSLVRKELVRPEDSPFADEDGFRFRHALIRDAAYAEIPKGIRADLHERFAGWLEGREGEDELVGYHIEQAYRCRADLGTVDAELAERAGRLLAAAGHRAVARDDMPAAHSLLERALALTDLGAGRAAALRDLAGALWSQGESARAAQLVDEAVDTAVRLGDLRGEWYARLERATRRRTTEAGEEDLPAVARQAITVFESLDDKLGLARAWSRLAISSLTDCRHADAGEQSECALAHLRDVDDPTEAARIVDILGSALLFGPMPAPEATARCRELLTLDGNRVGEAGVRSALAGLEALQGRFAAARAEAAAAAEIYDELGLRLLRAGLAYVIGSAELLAGDTATAERELRLACETFAEAGARLVLGLTQAQLAGVLLEDGRLDDAEQLLAEAEAAIDERDVRTVAACRQTGALVAAARGRPEDALVLAQAAVDVLAPTDALVWRGDALAVLAAVSGAEPVDAIALYEQKGAVAAIVRLRAERAPA